MHAYGNTAKNKNINKNITQQQKFLKEKYPLKDYLV